MLSFSCVLYIPYVRSYTVLYLDGSTNTKKRQKLCDQFNDPSSSIFVFLMSTRAGGVGLNLTAANVVIIFDPTWNPASDAQAEDRAFRMGQRKFVNIFKLVSEGGIEEQKFIRQVYKSQLTSNVMDGSNSARVFEGMQGSKGDLGQIFGLANLMRFDDEGHFRRIRARAEEARKARRVGMDAAAKEADDRAYDEAFTARGGVQEDDDDEEEEESSSSGDDAAAAAAGGKVVTGGVAAATIAELTPLQRLSNDLLLSENSSFSGEEREAVLGRIESQLTARFRRAAKLLGKVPGMVGLLRDRTIELSVLLKRIARMMGQNARTGQPWTEDAILDVAAAAMMSSSSSASSSSSSSSAAAAAAAAVVAAGVGASGGAQASSAVEEGTHSDVDSCDQMERLLVPR